MPAVKNSRPVYSTDSGRLCNACGRALAACGCRQREEAQIRGDGKVRLWLETKGRKGKGVTLISGLPLPAAELKGLAQRLRQLCSSGGTVREGVVEIQGDHRDRLLIELQKAGYAARRAGG